MSTFDHPARTRRVHPWNLVLGLAFLAVAATWAALEHDVVEGRDVGRLLAWGLIALGAVGIVGTLLATRRRGPASAATPSTTTSPTSDTDTDTDTDGDGDGDGDKHEHA